MSEKKIYARQIAPEWQESHLNLDDDCYAGYIILDGNRYYQSHTTPEYDAILSRSF